MRLNHVFDLQLLYVGLDLFMSLINLFHLFDDFDPCVTRWLTMETMEWFDILLKIPY